MIIIYTIIAGLLGLIPGIAYFLIILETWMIYSIAHGHHVDNTGEIFTWILISGAISFALKSVAHLLHLAPVVGQIANSAVAVLFVGILYTMADSHYKHLEQTGMHPDAIPGVSYSPSPTKSPAP
jgi:hypothetical protein